MEIKNISSVPIPLEELDKIQQLCCDFCHTYYPTGPLWMGTQPMQWANDLFYYQDIVWKTLPDVIIETGTLNGGVPSFLVDVFTLMKMKGKITSLPKIITIDINKPKCELPKEVTFIHGKSIEVIDEVRSFFSFGDKVMVLLDSQHDKEYVLKEMIAYGSLVTEGMYMIVQDTSGDIRNWSDGGPWGAIKNYLMFYDDFEIDYFYDRWILTQHPRGYLKKKELYQND